MLAPLRGAGERLGVSGTVSLVAVGDAVLALTPGEREYRAQGIEGNDRVGDVSPVESVVTVP